RRRALEQLGREVAGRPHDEAGRRDPGVLEALRDAEVDEHGTARGDHDVAGLEVAVHDARGVHGLEGGGELVGELVEVPRVERPALGDLVLERRAVDELGDDERVGSVELDVEDLGHGGVPQALEREGLAAQALAPLGGRVEVEVRVEQLDRDEVPAAVVRAVDGPHGPRAEPRADEVAPDLAAGSGSARRPAGDGPRVDALRGLLHGDKVAAAGRVGGPTGPVGRSAAARGGRTVRATAGPTTLGRPDAIHRSSRRSPLAGKEGFDLVVVANRLPVDFTVGPGGDVEWNRSPGGLVTALEPVMQASDGAWVGWSGAPDLASEPFDADDMRLVPVTLSADEIERYYEGFSNDTLWPL